MGSSPETTVRELLAQWGEPKPEMLATFFAKDAVWVDGPNGVHRGGQNIGDELTRQLSIFPGNWIEVDALVANGNTVMVEWHGGFPLGGSTVETKVMATFLFDASGLITQMRECFDMKSLTDQIQAAGIRAPK